MSTTSRHVHGISRFAAISVVMICSATGSAAAQDSLRIARESASLAKRLAEAREALPIAEHAVVTARAAIAATGLPVRWYAPGAQQVPQDVRIMQTIVTTALSEVEPPEMPRGLAGDSAGRGTAGSTGVYAVAPRAPFFNRGDVSGFYMQGYGYLFTVRWPVGSSMPLFNVQITALNAAMESQQAALESAQAQMEQLTQQRAQAQTDTLRDQAKAEVQRARVKAEMERQLQQRKVRAERLRGDQVRSKALAEWAAQYRQRLSNALKDAIAGYASTLRRARPSESITFIADFGGGDSARVTMTVKAGALQGSNLAANRSAVRVSTGRSGMSERLRTQLQIMSRIIDTSLGPPDASDLVRRSDGNIYFGGQAEPQYVQGYGVIFRKNARMNTARMFASISTRAWRDARGTAVDSAQLAARKSYQEHLDTLRRKTAQILAAYGPTLTELPDSDWVGIYYDVGSAAALLDGGAEDYLVQARMHDIRQAAAQSDPTSWLERRLVTNDKED